MLVIVVISRRKNRKGIILCEKRIVSNSVIIDKEFSENGVAKYNFQCDLYKKQQNKFTIKSPK